MTDQRSMSPEVFETALQFDCKGETLFGVLSHAVGPAAERPGVVIVVGGPQYRAGSHRQFVSLARALARAGHPVLRFDYSGMGDSSGALRNFEQVHDDIAAALDAFCSHPAGARQVVLWGLCDGASAALLYLQARGDRRVTGLTLLNPWVRSEASLAKTHVKHYYLQRLQQPEFWLKLLKGGVALGAAKGLWRNMRTAFGSGTNRSETGQPSAPYQQRMAQAWSQFSGSVLLLLSEHDLTAREFVEYTATDASWQRCLQQRPPTRLTLAGADHTCSVPGSQQAAEQATVQWLTDGPSLVRTPT